MATHKAKQGECFLSIAANHGFTWEALWKDEGNKKLAELRKVPTILKPGDVVHLPELKASEHDRKTDAKHKFKLKGTPAKLRLRLLDNGKPRVNVKCTFHIDGKEGKMIAKSTDGDGKLVLDIPPQAQQVWMEVGDEKEEHLLRVGWLDPMDSLHGLQARLNNLGFDCGKVDGDWGTNTQGGMQAFQANRKIKKTTKPDDATRERIEKDYGY